jgi:hypothetical protein
MIERESSQMNSSSDLDDSEKEDQLMEELDEQPADDSGEDIPVQMPCIEDTSSAIEPSTQWQKITAQIIPLLKKYSQDKKSSP